MKREKPRTQIEEASPVAPQPETWKPATRLAFRFCFAYLGLFSLATQITGSLFVIPFVPYRGLGILWPMREITFWIAQNIFHITSPLIYDGNSRDTDFYWIQTLWILIVAIVATAIWSALDRRRENYVTLHKWFRLFIRFGLASQMFEYGMTKVIPTQFQSPTLVTLATPAGDLSLQAMLWTSVGASFAYEMFTGAAELVGGALLLIPRTTMLGAMICLADMAQVFVLNMAYDIGVKQVSFHLILLSLFLLTPDFRRLKNFFFLDRPVDVASHSSLFRTGPANRIALAAQIVVGIYLLGMQADANWNYWYAEGGGAAKSPFYGIWNVEELAINGQAGPAALNDYDRRWKRVIFDKPESIVFQRTDDSFARYGASIDRYAHTVALTKGRSKTWRSGFTFERPAQDRLVLDGEMDGFKIHLALQLVDPAALRLLNSRFRWVRPAEP
jgi:hypothetical protein